MTSTPSVDNILSVYRRASFATWSEGMTWYDDAHMFARTLDPVRFHRAAGVIAALSPMNHWETNKKGAAKVYAQGFARGTHTRNNEAKADLILNGEDALDVLKGNKVRAFYLTIVDPTADIDPVIDRHAFDIAIGRRTDDKTRTALGRKGVYREFADTYRAAAKIVGIGASQLQAVTWVQWREEDALVD